MRVLFHVGLLLYLVLPSLASGKYAQVHGIKMYYQIHGQGRTVVLLHGGLATTRLSHFPIGRTG